MRSALRRPFVLLLLALTACASPEPATDAPARPPNVIFIMADDLGYGDLGAYGQAAIQTPHLDQMAAEGTRFTAYYAGSPVCAPSRSVLMTGRHTGRTTVRNNVGWQPRGDAPLRPEDVTPAEVLRAAGYATGAFGKWALGLEDTEGAPHRQGFDAFFGLTDQSAVKRYDHDEYQQIVDGETVHVTGFSGRYSHDLIMERALGWIERQAATSPDAPFFVYLAVPIPHADLDAPGDALEPYLDADGASRFEEPADPDYGGYMPTPHPNATYAAMVTHLDATIGALLDRLRTLDLADDTVVLFTSDNGPHQEGGYDGDFFDSNGPLRGHKRDVYEGGIRVPMIAWGPGRVSAGRVVEAPWAAWDVLPTLAALAGTEPPDDLDGVDVSAMLLGEEPRADLTERPLYWEFFLPSAQQFRQAVRQGDWKAIRFTQPDGSQRVELYNLATDLGETTDVAAKRPDVARRLVRVMEAAHETPALEEFRVAHIDD